MEKYIFLTEHMRKKEWCEARGWTELFFQEGKWYAFPPNAVIPQPIPRSWSDYRSVIIELFCFLFYRLLMFVIIYTILEVIAQF